MNAGDDCFESILFRTWRSPLSNILSLKSLKPQTLEMALTHDWSWHPRVFKSMGHRHTPFILLTILFHTLEQVADVIEFVAFVRFGVIFRFRDSIPKHSTADSRFEDSMIWGGAISES